MWAPAQHRTKEKQSVGVVDYEGEKGDFSAGMEKMLALKRASIVVVREYPKLAEAIGRLLEVQVSLEGKVAAGTLGFKTGEGFRRWSADEMQTLRKALAAHLVSAQIERAIHFKVKAERFGQFPNKHL